MKKILFILFATQFILAPYIIKSYGANLIEDNYEYSGVNQGRKTVEKDIFGYISPTHIQGRKLRRTL